jgi:hypothetical protein
VVLFSAIFSPHTRNTSVLKYAQERQKETAKVKEFCTRSTTVITTDDEEQIKLLL